VKAGDLLYEIDPVQYQAALDSAEAAVLKAHSQSS
jgi:membrane fusion protein (multidrug efflux system)